MFIPHTVRLFWCGDDIRVPQGYYQTNGLFYPVTGVLYSQEYLTLAG